jgi:agmatinase
MCGIEAYTAGIYTDTPQLDLSTPDAMVQSVYERVCHFMDKGKMVGLLGGEHSVSVGAIRAAKERHPNLSVLQIDAHADLRDEYHHSPFNHACVMRRAQEMEANVVQVGIRNVCIEEKPNIVEDNTFYAHHIVGTNPEWMDRVCDRLTDEVYLTIDLDGLDPSVLPATGTPLPGGLSWYELVRLLDKVARNRRIVGFDVVELCPQPDNVVSDVLAATLVYRIITLLEMYQHNS